MRRVSGPACERCGSKRLRRARTRSEWQRLVRRLTPFHRYACGDCGHRGWTTHRLERGSREAEAADGASRTPARPLEARDFRAARRLRLRMVVTVVVATVLGVLVAYFLSRPSPE